ncbi:hypothetical protein [Intestinibacter sp.]
MTFINSTSNLIRRSSKDIFYIFNNNGLYYNYYNENNELVKQSILISNNIFDYTQFYFTIDECDKIYGIITDNAIKIAECKKDSDIFLLKETFSFDHEKFAVCFPYIKYVGDTTHMFYYVYSPQFTNSAVIFHQYKNEQGEWLESQIDMINFNMLDGFHVVFNDDIPTIFYLNLAGETEELFYSTFDFKNLKWYQPIQLTNTKTSKLYLNILKDDDNNLYHIVFCENIQNQYCVKYMNYNIKDGVLTQNTCCFLSEPPLCTFPCLIKENSILYAMWISFDKLFTSFSKDLGKTWSKPICDETSTNEYFLRTHVHSNVGDDLIYKEVDLFTTINNLSILGF